MGVDINMPGKTIVINGNGTVKLNGYKITTGTLRLGNQLTGTIDYTGGGSLDVDTLSVQSGSSVTLGAGDMIDNLETVGNNGGTVTTASANNYLNSVMSTAAR